MAYDIIIGRDESDKEKFGKSGLIYIGKGFVKMGSYTSLSNFIFSDIAVCTARRYFTSSSSNLNI